MAERFAYQLGAQAMQCTRNVIVVLLAARWLSEGRADGADNWPNLFHMFETGEEDGVMKGKQLTFTKREASEAPSKGWQEELSVSGAATVGIYQCIEVDESGSEVESDVEEEEEDSVKRKEEDEENVATSSNKERAKTRKPRTTKGAAVKKDSKVMWSFDILQKACFAVLQGASCR